MNNKVFGVFTFVAGAIIGSVVTWKVVKTKYERIAQEEIESVKEVFTVPKCEESEEPSEEPDPKSKLQEYADKLNELDYGEVGEIKEEGDEEPMGPYVISPDEFGERMGYETVSLTYYEDGILTDQADEIIRDIEHVVGLDSLDHFGEYEDDSVFVRNEDLKIDFEILKDIRNFKDVRESAPVHQMHWWGDDE